jgi:hypothetical protein
MTSKGALVPKLLTTLGAVARWTLYNMHSPLVVIQTAAGGVDLVTLLALVLPPLVRTHMRLGMSIEQAAGHESGPANIARVGKHQMEHLRVPVSRDDMLVLCVHVQCGGVPVLGRAILAFESGLPMCHPVFY